MNFRKVKLDHDNRFAENSKKRVIPGNQYKITTEVTGVKGEPFCAYFGVVILDKNGKEIDRKIRWLNDFSGKPKIENIVFRSDEEDIIIIYRVNEETPVKSSCEYDLLQIKEIKIESIIDIDNDYDELNDYVFPKPEELTKEQEDNLEKNIVWIYGSPRSGTSWLGLELLSYNTLQINETHITEFVGAREGQIKEKVVRRIDNQKNIADYFFSKAYKKVWGYYLRKMILNRVFAQVKSTSKKIILKEPAAISAADIISEIMPKSKIIILLRDGRDVLDSLIDARQKEGFMTKRSGVVAITGKSKLRFIKEQAKLSVKLIDVLLKTYDNHPPENRFIVKYEDLRTNPLENLEKIYKFIGIEINKDKLERIVDRYTFEKIPKEMRGKGKFARSASPGKWKDNFNEKEIQLMNEIMGETLKRVGY